LTGGAARPAEWAVPGAHALLDQLRARGLALALASGTEIDHVRREAELLGLAGYFGERIYAPADVLAPFAKGAVIAALVAEWGLGPGELLGFGDGVVETEEVRRAGGVAVGVASRPRGETGINPWKRRQLVAAGADLIIPDYRQAGPVVDGLCKG
jgi:phosphoglycolate phosphatase-like HAD superfamily hydrolase